MIHIQLYVKVWFFLPHFWSFLIQRITTKKILMFKCPSVIAR